MPGYRVVIADDDERVRDALSDALSASGMFHVVGAAADGASALEMTSRTTPDMVLVDVRMPGGGGELVRGLRRVHPRVVAVGISAHTDASVVRDMVASGATGFLAKGQLGDMLLDILLRCARGEVVIATRSGATALRQLLDPDGGRGR